MEKKERPVMTVNGVTLVEGEHFTVSQWDKYVNYDCAFCAFSTIFPKKLEDHFEKGEKHQHAWGKPGAVPLPAETDGELRYE